MSFDVKRYDVFLSYSSADRNIVRELDTCLRARNVRTFVDQRDLRAGIPWIVALEEAINQSDGVAILVGGHGLGNVQQYERDLALVRQSKISDRRFPVIPVLLPGCETPPTGFLELLTWIDLRGGVDDPGALDRLLETLKGNTGGASPARESVCPYMGLEPFREEDSALFCGRADTVQELVGKVREHALVAVVGRSGSGKSSLIFAGLAPELRRQRPYLVWDVISLRPGAWPLHALASALEDEASNVGTISQDGEIERAASHLREGSIDTLARVIRRRLDTAPGAPNRLLLYVDQWEELYSMGPVEEGDAKRRHASDVERFIELLLATSSDSRACTSVVFTVRADFYGALVAHPDLGARLPLQQVNIGPMSREDLRACIETPAEKSGLSFEPATLIEEILDDAGTDEAILPLLQYALKETWTRRTGRVMTSTGYMTAGGVRGAIQSTANRIYNCELNESEKVVARRLFLGLVTPGEGREDTRARIPMPTDPGVRGIIDKFTGPRARLLVTGSERVGTLRRTAVDDHSLPVSTITAYAPVQGTLEIAHEALIRTWSELRHWLDANRDILRSRSAIVQQRREWEANDRRPDLLLAPGFQLERGRALLAGIGDVPIDDVRDYIEASVEQEALRIAVQRTASLRERRRLQWLTFAALLVAATFGLLAVFAYNRTRAANDATDRATSAERNATEQASKARESLAIAIYQKGRAAEREGRWNVAAMYFAAARVQHDTPNARWAAGLAEAQAIVALSRHAGHVDQVNAVAFSPDGEQVVSVDRAGGARVWLRSNGATLAETKLPNGLWAVAFSPDGSELSIGDEAGVIYRMTPNLSKLATNLEGHSSQIWSLAYSPDGGTIASASEDSSIRLWPRNGGKPRVLHGHTQRVYSVAFSPDGSELASGSDDRQLWRWNVVTGRGARRADNPGGGIRAVAFVGDSIFAGAWDGVLGTWGGRSINDKIGRRWGDMNSVHAVAVTPNARILITAGDTGLVRFWDFATTQPVAALEAPGGRTAALAVSRDGRWLVTGGQDRYPIVWDLSALPRLIDAVGHMQSVQRVTLSADGSQILSASDDKTLRIWAAKTGAQLRVFSTGDAYCKESTALLRDGTVVGACSDHTFRHWSPEGQDVKTATGIWMHFGSLSPNQETFVGGHIDGKVQTVDLVTNALGRVRTLHRHHIYVIQHSPNGLMLTAGLDSMVKVWTSKLEPVAQFAADSREGVVAAALSRDGRIAISGSQDGVVEAWNVATKERIARQQAHLGAIWAVTHMRNRVYTAGADGLVKTWDATTWKQVRTFKADEAQAITLTASEDGTRLVAGYQNGALVAWDTAIGEPIWRTGGRSREHGSCNNFSTQTWVDDAHREIVATACRSEARTYFAGYAKRSHQLLENDIDVKASW